MAPAGRGQCSRAGLGCRGWRRGVGFCRGACFAGFAAVTSRASVCRTGGSSDANAQGVRVKLHATGLASTAQASDTPVGRLIRVRAGPFESKDEAERAALRIKAFELPAVLVRQ